MIECRPSFFQDWSAPVQLGGMMKTRYEETRAVSEVRDAGSLLGRFSRNSLIVLATQVLTKALLFGITVLVARKLGPAGNGKFAFAFALTALFSVIATFGMDPLLVREVSRSPRAAGPLAATSLLLRILFSALSISGMVLVLLLIGKPADVFRLTLLLGLSMAFSVFSFTFYSVFEGHELFHVKGFLSVSSFALKFASIFIGLSRGYGLLFIGLVCLASDLLTFLACMAVSGRITGRLRMKAPVLPEMASMLRTAVPFVAATAFVMVYYRVDTVLLSVLRTDREVGWYDAAYNFIYGLRLFPASGAAAVLPVLSRLFIADRPRALRLYRKIFLIAGAASLPLVVGFFFASAHLVRFVYGEAYLPAAAALRILVWVGALMFVNAFQGVFLIAANRQNDLLLATAVGALSNIVFNVIFIPSWSLYGAALATVLSEILVFFVCRRKVSAVLKGID
jgi:O-antigen/teichoic acid export membrane protein